MFVQVAVCVSGCRSPRRHARRYRRGRVRVVARERDKGVVRVRRIDRDPAHEPLRRRRGVDTVKSRGPRSRCRRSSRRTRGRGAVRPTACVSLGARWTRRRSPPAGVLSIPSRTSAGKVASRPAPSGTQSPHRPAELPGPEELVASLQEGLVAAIVLRAPDVLEPDEPVSRLPRVRDQRDVEGRPSPLGQQRSANPVPAQLVVPVEVDVALEREERVHPDVRVAGIDPRLAAVAEDRHEPLIPVPRRLGAVVLRPAMISLRLRG